eukprot:2063951-Pyramimonas_sp.AAC.1
MNQQISAAVSHQSSVVSRLRMNQQICAAIGDKSFATAPSPLAGTLAAGQNVAKSGSAGAKQGLDGLVERLNKGLFAALSPYLWGAAGPHGGRAGAVTGAPPLGGPPGSVQRKHALLWDCIGGG